MKYFLLSVTMKCNKSCPYCVVKEYLNTPKHPDRIIYPELERFLDARMDDGDFAEITGGEPTLWPHLPLLLGYLEKRSCHILIRTNGAKVFDLSKHKRLYVYLAQHGSSDEWARDRFRQMNCSGMISNKGNIPVIVRRSTIAEAKIMEDEPARFSECYFVDNEARIRFMPCDEIFIGNLADGIERDYRFICNNKCPFKQGAWEVYKRIINSLHDG